MHLLSLFIFSFQLHAAGPADSSDIVLDWVILKDNKTVRQADRDSIILSSTVQKANNKMVTVTGFMLPPDEKNENSEYELTEESHLSCLHTDDDQIIKLHLKFKKTETLQFTPIWVRGILTIDRNENGVVRLTLKNAEIIHRDD